MRGAAAIAILGVALALVGAGCGGGGSDQGHGLLFVRQQGDVSRIFLWRPGAAAPVPIGPKGNYIDAVAWSPDGEEIAFAGQQGAWDEGNVTNVYEMHADGTDVHSLTADADRPIWSPGGDRLLYYPADGRNVVIVYSFRTGRAEPLPIVPGLAAWGSSGIAYVRPGSRTITLFDPGLGFSKVFARTETGVDDLAWLKGGRLAVLDNERRQIVVYSAYGHLLARLHVRGRTTACGITSADGGAELLVPVKGPPNNLVWTTTLAGKRWRRLPAAESGGAWCRTSWSWR